MNLSLLTTELMRDEGVVLTPYRCPAGKLTVGAGRNLDDNPLSPAELAEIGHDARTAPITRCQAAYLLGNDIRRIMAALDKTIPWWSHLDEVRRRVLVNMAYNLGVGGLMEFHGTLRLLEIGHYKTAAITMLQSVWAGQVGRRATRLAEMMRTGAMAD